MMIYKNKKVKTKEVYLLLQAPLNKKAAKLFNFKINNLRTNENSRVSNPSLLIILKSNFKLLNFTYINFYITNKIIS